MVLLFDQELVEGFVYCLDVVLQARSTMRSICSNRQTYMLNGNEIWLDHRKMVDFFPLEHANDTSVIYTWSKYRKQIIDKCRCF